MKRLKSRREFLRLAASSAGAAIGMSMFPPAIRKALAIPANHVTGTIQDVEHVVILMQENRSFDHYFGTLRGVRGFNDPRPMIMANGKPVWYQPPATIHTEHYQSRGLSDDVPYVLPFYLDPKSTTEYTPSTDHQWSSSHQSWNHGKYDQWVNQKQDVATMGYLKRKDVSYHYALAEAFTICDAYHCSVFADTAPNRIYLWTGTIDPRNAYGTKPNGPGLSERHHVNGYTWMTYPERLEANHISWKLYQGGSGVPGQSTDNGTDNSLEFFSQYQVQEGASPTGTLVQNGVSSHTMVEFREDVVNNRLPQVTWIVAPSEYCEHPSHCPTNGAYYINLVMEALTANPEVWSKTALFLNYDENDGQFDHVVPPMPPMISARNAQGMVSNSLQKSMEDEFLDLDHNNYPHEKNPLVPGAEPGGIQPIGLGPRVPMIIISPWSTGGWVCSQMFDHTSVLQFLEARFNVPAPHISAWRRSLCGDLTSAFDFSSRPDASIRSFQVPALLHSLNQPYRVQVEKSMPKQEPGTRRARAIPYEFVVHARLQDSKTQAIQQKVWLDFANTGKAGAAFYVYDRKRPDTNPRRYTVAANDAFSDYWPTSDTQGAYDLTVHGPNGSMYQFQGNTVEAASKGKPNPEVKVVYDVAGRNVSLVLTNQGGVSCTLKVVNRYDKAVAHTHSVSAGKSIQDHWGLKSSAGWYDISVTSAEDPTFLRRFAGHVESGRPSTSDPAVFEEDA